MNTVPRRILIVDDEQNVCNALRQEGYELYIANEPAAALETLKRVPIDLVISDHLMPNMTGIEFLQLVRDRHPNTMRMMLTGHADMQTAIKGINNGEIYRFLTKPWDDVELKVTLFLAFEQLDLERENRKLLATVRRQHSLIKNLEQEHPGIGELARDADGAIVIEDPGALSH